MSSPATSNAAVKDNHPAMVKQAADATAAAKEKEDSGARAAAREAAADAAAAAATAPPSAPAPVPGGSLQFRSDMLLVGGKPGLFHCNYCMRDISNTIRIKCAETSTCPDWDLCVDCFGAGVELGKHKNDHPYRVVDNTAYPIFAPDWTATEELLMLSALEAHGMGNWGKVAEVLNSKDKTEKACMEHYLDLYLHSYGSILPKDTVGYGKTHDLLTEEQRKEYVMGPLDMETYPEALHLKGAPPPPPHGTPYSREKGGKEKREGGREGGEASSGRGEGKEGSQAKEGGPAANPLPSESVIPGYMPLRGDFDVEHDNEAELILAEMEILPDEDPAEKELKLMVVDVFNRKLDERDRRKEFVKTFNLTDYKALQNKEKRKPKDERELIAKLRVFARYQTPQEHEQFVLGILEAKRLRKRIEQLQQYRRLGIRTQADALAYENEKRKREQEQQMRKQRADASYLYETAKPGNTTKDRSSRYKKRHRGDSDMDSAVAGLEDAEGGGGGRGGGGGEGGAKRKGPMVLPGPLNIDEYPGVELLSGKEKELCAALRLLPKHYLYIKNRILQESQAAGLLLPTTTTSSSSSSNGSSDRMDGKEGEKGGQGRPPSSLIVMDVEKKKGVYDFMVRVGWITPRAAASRSDVKDISITVSGGEGGAVSESSSLPPSSSPPSAKKGRPPGSGKEAGEEEGEEKGSGGDRIDVDEARPEKEKGGEGAGGGGGKGEKGTCPPSTASQRKSSRSSPSPSPSSPAQSGKKKGVSEEGKGKVEASAMET